MTHTCANCKKSFEARKARGANAYCSSACSYAHKRYSFNKCCRHCGARFLAAVNQVYCSEDCLIVSKIPEPSAGGCRIWLGAKSAGYAMGANRRVSRYLWERANGTIPEGLVVRHKCDNAACVELSHLELGTHAENMKDRDSRGRQFRGSHKMPGVDKLILDIYGDGSHHISQATLAKTFYMSKSGVEYLMKNRVSA